MNKKLLLLVLFSIAYSNAYSDISNKQFMTHFLTHFSKQSCAEKGVLRHCFRVKQKPCLASTAVAAKHCQKIIGNAMPTRLRNSVESGIWGSKLASCISKHFSKQNSSLINKTDHSCLNLNTPN